MPTGFLFITIHFTSSDILLIILGGLAILAVNLAAVVLPLMALGALLKRRWRRALILALIAAPVALLGHGAKAVTRPAVTVSTAGVGNPVASLAEDGWALVLTGLALLAPLLIPLAIVFSIWVMWRVARWLGHGLFSTNPRKVTPNERTRNPGQPGRRL